MKQIILTLLLGTMISTLLQAQSNFHNIHYLDPYNPEYVKGEVLIKFKDEVSVKAAFKSGVALTGVTSVDALLKAYQPEAVTKIFKETREQRQQKTVRTIRDFKGKEIEVPALYNIYKLQFDTVWDAKQIIEELQKDENVEFAEPNYLVYTSEVIESGAVPDQAPTLSPLPTNKGNRNTTPNDPLYANGSQWYLDSINAPAAWDSITGDTTQIIAIIDTGVDWDHPDLDDNIWTNWNEIPDNGIDDDNNGYVDDTRGWDYINNDNDPNDDNSHGTHVAGIAAAEGNNGIGICGVAWNARIMPIKTLQSSGIGNSSDLASSIEYASYNGATIINMSLGSYGESSTVRTVLENAYASSFLIAAAGNDGHCLCNDCIICGTFFPAAYSFVLGVQVHADWSNFDPSGPITYNNNWGYNYEVYAPGVSIMSTIPNGNYKYLSGTSMAAPVVAGSISLLNHYYPNLNNEERYVRLVQINEGDLNLFDLLFEEVYTNLYYINLQIIDTCASCDQDNSGDAGETVSLKITVKNAGASADSVWLTLGFGEFEDTTTATIIDSTCFFGNLSSFATINSDIDPNPITITIDSSLAHNRDIVFKYNLSSPSAPDTSSGNIIINTQNGEEIGGFYSSNLHLKRNKYYYGTSSVVVDSDDTLFIDPGVQILMGSGKGINVMGTLLANGKVDSMILLSSYDSYWSSLSIAKGELNYVIIEKTSGDDFSFLPDVYFNNCIFRDNRNYDIFQMSDYSVMNYCNIVDNISDRWTKYHLSYGNWNNMLISNNKSNHWSSPFVCGNGNAIIKNSAFYNNQPYNLAAFHGNISWIQYFPVPNYYGCITHDAIEENYYDYFDNSSYGIISIDTFAYSPNPEIHGMVWKVTINDIYVHKQDNPYYSPNGLGVIGSETIKFDVFFNRAMDTSFTPFVSFGVREPYTQNLVNDSARWSSDSTIWTAYCTIGLKTGDGVQRVRVAMAKDTDHFDIPTENQRFEFVVQAAGSASVDFTAIPGIGKVDLEWPPTPSDDALGYNLYRFYNLTDSTYSDTLMINTELILDTLFTDFNVIPDTTYHYLYKTLGTDMVETDYSKKATATPFSAATGDANGDMAVNVLDITTIVSYILNQNPQPFLSDAADVNYDGQVNLLDIIGVVNLIMNNKAVSDRPYPMISQQKAYYEWRGNALWLHSDGNLAGLQFDLMLPNQQQPNNIHIKSRLEGFEFAWNQSANQIKALLFSLNERVIPAGALHVLDILGLETGTTPPEFTTIFGGDLIGDQVTVWPYGIDQLDEQNSKADKLWVKPNPFSHHLEVNWDIEKASSVSLKIYSLSGKLIELLYEGNNKTGNAKWQGQTNEQDGQGKGIYILRLEYLVGETAHSIERKVIKL